MTQKTFANLLKAVIVLAFLCCAVVYAFYVPAIAQEAADVYAEYSALYVPALVFVELTALPILPIVVIVNALDLIKCAVGFFLVRSRRWVNNLVAV